MISTSRLWAELSGISPELAAADSAAVDDWHADGADSASEDPEEEDDYPVLLRLAALGSSFAARVNRMSAWQREQLLGRLNEVLVSGPEHEQNAVATGFLEALVSAYDRGDFDLATIWHELGEESRHYIKLWNTRTGAAVPYWMTFREPPEPQPPGAAVALLRDSCDLLASADDRLLNTATEARSAEPDYDLEHRVENMASEFVRDFHEIDRASRAKVFEALEKVVLGAPEGDVAAVRERFVPALVAGCRRGVLHPMLILSGLGAHTAHCFKKVDDDMDRCGRG
ncbi:hypothetical protein [Actinopolyspora mortivallis]|uniref:Uncharacterized protein n=1 Tax=Actinopolyspora mortivallis TaxID=33906 RepID=A0A2T0GXW7_ACTMO|nr:hypothetical protein [Actinopolyspora mortivallis]PRW63940.1 hypothetical protein CEP50_08210 [Actinopolyspora mortivallis]